MATVAQNEVKISYTRHDQVFSGCQKCSFDIVATNFVKYYNKYVANGDESKTLEVAYRPSPSVKLVIADMWMVLENFTSLSLPYDVILWIDTAWVASDISPQPITKTLTVVTTSNWNSQILTMNGIRNYIVPRAVDDELIDSVFENVRRNPTNYKYDFFFLSTSNGDGHKNESLVYKVLRDLNELTKSFKVCNFSWCDVKPFTLTEEQKYDIMSKSRVAIWLSESEGFGLPPTEAMGVGVPVIRFDSHYVDAPFTASGSDTITQFKIPVYGYKLRRSPTAQSKYFPSYIYDYDDVVKTFKEALYTTSDETKDETFEIRYKLHEYVKHNFYHSVVINKFMNIDELRVRLHG